MATLRLVGLGAVLLAGSVASGAPFSAGASTSRAGIDNPVAGTDCQAFPADNWWHADVTNLPVHALSDQWMSRMSPQSDLHPDFGPSFGDGPNYGIPITVVKSSHAKVTVRFQYA